jgi:hypothetical protein
MFSSKESQNEIIQELKILNYEQIISWLKSYHFILSNEAG